jgi:hypothetical protein
MSTYWANISPVAGSSIGILHRCQQSGHLRTASRKGMADGLFHDLHLASGSLLTGHPHLVCCLCFSHGSPYGV